MAAAYNQVIIHYLDIDGRTCQTFWSTQDQTEGGAADYVDLADKVQACTDAAVIAVQYQSTVLIDATPADGDYPTVYDRAATLSKILSTNAPNTLQLVAPTSALFLPDTITLDLSNTDLIALQTEMMAKIGSPQGAAMGPIRRGYRTQARGTL
jgi:hypothetical protein